MHYSIRGHERCHIVLGLFWTGNLKEKVTAAQAGGAFPSAEQAGKGNGCKAPHVLALCLDMPSNAKPSIQNLIIQLPAIVLFKLYARGQTIFCPPFLQPNILFSFIVIMREVQYT
jgi:hypothetical protein